MITRGDSRSEKPEGDGSTLSLTTNPLPGAMAYLVPDLDTRGRPYRWSINVANADGSGSRSVVTASLTGGCRGQQSVHAV